MSDNSTPDGSNDQGSGGSQNESLPEEQQLQTPEAEEQNHDTPDNDSTGQSEPSEDSTGSDDSSSEVDGGSEDLSKWANSQGIDLENPSPEDAKKLAKRLRDTQHSLHEKSQLAKEAEELRNAVQDVNGPSEVEEDDFYAKGIEQATAAARLAQAEIKVMRFEEAHPEAKEYKGEMAKVLLDTKEQHGIEAARYLSNDLDTLLLKAKQLVGDSSSEAAREAGRREERESLRKKQEGATAPSSASQPSAGKSKITRESVAQMSDEEYAKIRESGELDEAMKSW